MKTQSISTIVATFLLAACSLDLPTVEPSSPGASQGLALSTVTSFEVTANSSSLEAKKRQRPEHQLETQLTWMDGGRERRVWLDESALIEFDPEPNADAWLSARGSAIEPTGAGEGKIRRWTLDEGFKASELLTQMKERGTASHFSQAYRASASKEGALMGLPGGVLVYLKPEIGDLAASQWFDSRGLTVRQKMSYGTSVYLIESPRGAACLELTSSLLESEDVVKALPNWWRAMRVQ